MRHLRRKTQVAAREVALSRPRNKNVTQSRGNYLTANPDGTVGAWWGAGIMEARRGERSRCTYKRLPDRGRRVNPAPLPRPSCPRYMINMILPSGKAAESKLACSVRQLVGVGLRRGSSQVSHRFPPNQLPTNTD